MTKESKRNSSPPSIGNVQNELQPSTFNQAVESTKVSNLHQWVEKFKKNPIYIIGGIVLTLLGTAVTAKKNWTELFPESDVTEIAKQLASDTPEIRMAALSQLQIFESKKQSELQLGLVVVQEMLSRRAPNDKKKNEDATVASKRETGMAMQALSNLLKQADKHQLPLQRPVFSRIDLTGLDLSGFYFRDTVWLDVNALDIRLVGTDLQGAHIDGTQLARVDASNADLTGATLKRVCLEGASLIQAKLIKARIIASDLNVASMQKADLTAATLQESRMAGADMTGAILTNADLGTATEWLPEQTAQAGKRDATSLPKTYSKVKLGICG